MLYRRGRQFAAYPQNSYTTEHPLPQRITNALFAYRSTSTIPTERICNHLGIAAKQIKNDAFSKIIRALESSDSLDEIDVDPDDHRAALLRKHLN